MEGIGRGSESDVETFYQRSERSGLKLTVAKGGKKGSVYGLIARGEETT